MRPIKLIIIILLFSAGWNASVNPVQQKPMESSNIAGYYLVDPLVAPVSMKVNIWGEVHFPGRYVIPYSDEYNLLSLISLAGGPKVNNPVSFNVIIIREMHGAAEKEFIKFKLRNYIDGGDVEDLPIIEPDDIVIVQSSLTSRLFSKRYNFIHMAILLILTFHLSNY